MANLYEMWQKAQRAAGTALDQGEPAPAGRDYSAIYRAVYDYHGRHNPPHLTDEYWQAAAKDVCDTVTGHGSDPFIIALLEAVYSEMEREYNHLKAACPPASERTA